jgi:hypothetical protein
VELSSGDRALPAILPRSQDPVDDSDSRDRLPRFGAYLPGLGVLAFGIGRGRRDELVGDSDMMTGGLVLVPFDGLTAVDTESADDRKQVEGGLSTGSR